MSTEFVVGVDMVGSRSSLQIQGVGESCGTREGQSRPAIGLNMVLHAPTWFLL